MDCEVMPGGRQSLHAGGRPATQSTRRVNIGFFDGCNTAGAGIGLPA